jgi:hypothetical protein
LFNFVFNLGVMLEILQIFLHNSYKLMSPIETFIYHVVEVTLIISIVTLVCKTFVIKLVVVSEFSNILKIQILFYVHYRRIV